MRDGVEHYRALHPAAAPVVTFIMYLYVIIMLPMIFILIFHIFFINTISALSNYFVSI